MKMSVFDLLIPESVMTDALLSRKPFTVSAQVKGDGISDEVAVWSRRLTESEKVTLRDGPKNDGWKFFLYEYDPKKCKRYKIVKRKKLMDSEYVGNL